jgi:hypothetical protein
MRGDVAISVLNLCNIAKLKSNFDKSEIRYTRQLQEAWGSGHKGND